MHTSRQKIKQKLTLLTVGSRVRSRSRADSRDYSIARTGQKLDLELDLEQEDDDLARGLAGLKLEAISRHRSRSSFDPVLKGEDNDLARG